MAEGADHGKVDLELADEIDRRRADDAAIGLAHHAAGHHHFDARCIGEYVGNVEIVGDDHQALVAAQGMGNLFGGGADIEDQR